MKKICFAFLITMLAAAVVSCSKEMNAPAEAEKEVPAAALASIRALGFSTENVQRASGGYIVEGDILLSDADLASAPASPKMLIAKEEQYHTFNLVNTSTYRTISVRLYNTSSAHQTVFSKALDSAIARYNAQGLAFKFKRVNTGGHIVVNSYYEVSNTLGTSGFPSSTGIPYSNIRMNTYHYSSTTDVTNTQYVATVIAHELGHAVGFRHTDYMNRIFSCGNAVAVVNEGQDSTGVGAVHIPGTPTGADSGSWMLACIFNGVNRPFNDNDKIALTYVY